MEVTIYGVEGVEIKKIERKGVLWYELFFKKEKGTEKVIIFTKDNHGLKPLEGGKNE